jgi:SAM (Sterile alpha motif) domain-containing protein
MLTVSQWLEQLGLPQYIEVFERNAVDYDLLSELTDQDLEKIGVIALGHRRKLVKAIARAVSRERHRPCVASRATRPSVG